MNNLIKDTSFYIYRKFHNFFYILISYLIKILDFYTSKQNNLIVFAQKNKLFSDNSKAFFKYLLENNPELEIIWLVDTKSERDLLKNKYKITNVKIIKNFDGISTLLRSKVVVVSNALDDFFPFFRPSAKKISIQLWHGINWSKKFEYPNNNFVKEITIACASSSENKIQMAKQNRFPEDRIYITGLPRNDILFKKNEIILPENLSKFKNNNFLLYAPTHKENLVTDFFPFKDKDLNELNVFLKKNNSILFLRPHINDTNKAKIEFDHFFKSINQSQIKSLTFDEVQDVNGILPFIKILITDYSTIYADALLLDIPTIFVPYDIKEYINKRGLIYEYSDVAAGDKISTQLEFISSIEKILTNNYEHLNHMKKVKKIFHEYNDSNSSKRVSLILKKKLEILK